jgi:hypothetical protein
VQLALRAAMAAQTGSLMRLTSTRSMNSSSDSGWTMTPLRGTMRTRFSCISRWNA